jgi:rRNA maturation RNase YbeY
MDRELYRVIIHGILHLCGYSDKSAEEKAEMTALEDKYLSLLPH